MHRERGAMAIAHVESLEFTLKEERSRAGAGSVTPTAGKLLGVNPNRNRMTSVDFATNKQAATTLVIEIHAQI